MCGLLACVDAHAVVTRIAIDTVDAPTFDAREFGAVGRYEKLSGKAFGEVDPADPLNAGITYIQDAPRNARGRVEYVVDISILKPIEPSRGNGTLLYDVVNRGARRAFDVFHVGPGGGNNPSKAADVGDAYLLRQGYTLVVSGWQADLPKDPEEFNAYFPVAKRGAAPIAKTISVELIVTKPAFTLPIGWDNGRALLPYSTIERQAQRARLIRRAHADAADEVIARNEWSFGACPDGKTVTESLTDICLPAGFSPDAVYYLSYLAYDPIVMGLAFAATRDVVSFLRYDTSSANPLIARIGRDLQPNAIRRTIMFGRSQSGRFAKDFVYQGFNQDEAKRVVFDGTIELTGGGRLTNVNSEFSMPGRFSTTLVGHFTGGDQFPFTYETLKDPVSGRTDGLLERCRAQGVCPKIMHWDSGTEPWGARASLVRTDPLGKTDVKIPDNVRFYYFAGTQHVPAGVSAGAGICQSAPNPNPYREAARALLAAMNDWISAGKAPPATRYPSLADRTLVRPLPQREFGFPEIPGKRYTGEANHLFMNDDSEPPRHVKGKQYTVLVPKVDRDGNEVAGVRSATLQVPLGTYTGWGLRKKGYMEDRSCYLQGTFIPFVRWRIDRGNDPRRSLEERYVSKDNYVKLVDAAAQRLQQEGFLLPEDAQRISREARELYLGF
ncbi:MAG: hypothetical protein JWN94_1941 [Betaproteobacteria bacterium]|nr:hypothetical protein [Betaproteobacteria bacterium]